MDKMSSSTVSNAGFEVGIKFGGESSITIGGQTLQTYISQKQDKSTLLSDVYEVGSVMMTSQNDSPANFISNSQWTNLGSLELSSGNTIYFWERQF